MLEDKKLHALKESITGLFFANGAVTALSKLKKKATLSVKDEDVLLECADFFVKSGNQERYFHFMMLVNRRKLPAVVLQNLIDFFSKHSSEKRLETNKLLDS
ncbi:MAG: hypothetical protein Q8Q46_01215 [Candidatus Giovannonibacteria bacterium]|nr:hypothetical protein [Candidatus Giovannonibacteria bacterium]